MNRNFNPSEEQQKIFNFFRTGIGNIVINAKVGSGKSTTIIEALNVIPKNKKVLLIAHNRDIVDHLKNKVNRDEKNTNIFTYHSLGYKIIEENIGKKPEFDEYNASVLRESAKCDKVWFNDGEEVVLQMSEGGDNRQFIEDMFMKTHTLPNSFNPADGCVTFRYPAEECNGVFFKTIEEMGFSEKKPVNESADEQTIFDMDSEIYTANYKEGHDGGITFVIMRKMNGHYGIEGLSDTLIRAAGKIVDKIEETIGYENFFGSIDVENTLYCGEEGAFHVIVGLFEIDDNFGEKENLDVEIVGKMEKLGFEDYMKGDYIKFDYFTK
jgi:hypothetical protein